MIAVRLLFRQEIHQLIYQQARVHLPTRVLGRVTSVSVLRSSTPPRVLNTLRYSTAQKLASPPASLLLEKRLSDGTPLQSLREKCLSQYEPLSPAKPHCGADTRMRSVRLMLPLRAAPPVTCAVKESDCRPLSPT